MQRSPVERRAEPGATDSGAVGRTMLAARYHGPAAGLTLDEVAVPLPGSGEALVRVAAAGVCHTELQLLAGTLNPGVVPLTLGHEIAGEVVAVGPWVGEVQVGDHVVVYYYAPCGACRWCRANHENLCPNAGPQVGFTSDGGFAPYVRVPARSLVVLPEHLALDEACTLGCSVATALHALRAVARVALGDTIVVYGVGAVGFALVQLGQLMGARVIAVGRTPTKLALAAELGAERVVDAAMADAVDAVLEATDGQGAAAVFECVASAETMDGAVRMLRRRGRLVFVGYGAEPFVVNPLLLVLREAQVLGAVGNTLQELRESVALAAQGQVRPVVSERLPLADVGAALDGLRRGRVIGRAVLLPNGELPAPSGPRESWTGWRPVTVGAGESYPMGFSKEVPPSLQADSRSEAVERQPGAAIAGHSPHYAESRSLIDGVPRAAEAASPATPSAPPDRPMHSGANGEVSAAERGPAIRSRSAAPPRGSDFETLRADLLALIGRGVDVPSDEDEFEALALRLFVYQFGANLPYRQYCERKGLTPENVRRWQDVPAVPIAAFKEALLVCEPPERAAACFQSSGTTGSKRSQHFHPSLVVYDQSATTTWRAHLLPEGKPMRLLVLSPPREELPNSSLAHYLSLMLERFGGPGSGFLWRAGRLDLDVAVAALRDAEAADEAVALLGTSFAFVHLIDACTDGGLRFRLPGGSRVMDTGGFKGQSREISRTELYGLIRDTFDVPRECCVNMYGLTEHSTQFLDAVLRNRARGVEAPRYKTVPPWARTRVLDPETLEELPAGEIGLLCHHDLANLSSVGVVLTEDLGYALGDGFELLGRAQGAEARGCSIAIDELLSATRVES
jgi:propanol-preferring alcohol dehydrogenase